MLERSGIECTEAEALQEVEFVVVMSEIFATLYAVNDYHQCH